MVPLTTPPLGPNLLGWTDAGAAAFDGVPLTSQQKMSSLLVVDGYVRSHVRMSLTLGLVDPKSPPPDPYVTVLPLLLDPKRFPALVAAAPAIVDDNEGEDLFRDEMRFGLDVILDGIEALTHTSSSSKLT
jgi:Tetracyclin repressor-like, C-terminal domain